MEVAVAGVEDVGDLESVLVAGVGDRHQDLAELAERDGAVHAVVVGNPADGAECRLAALPDGGALLRRLADANRAWMKWLGELSDDIDEMGYLGVGAFHLDDQQRLHLERI